MIPRTSANSPPLSFSVKPTDSTTALVKPSVDLSFGAAANLGAGLESQTSFQNFGSATLAPTEVNFPTGKGNDVERYTQAVLNFPENQATPAEARQIATAVLAAAREFNVEPRLLLATLAHESHFDPQANNGNGKGLGQVTRPARQEIGRISRGGPNGHRARVSQDTNRRLRTPEARALFAQVNGSGSSRALLSVQPNVRTSAAYLRVMLDTGRGNVRTALSNYNGSGGAIQRAYPGNVASDYQQLWGTAMPAR